MTRGPLIGAALTLADLVEPVRRELEAREHPDARARRIAEMGEQAHERELTCWRRILALVEGKEVAIGFAERRSDAMAELMQGAQVALYRRVEQCLAQPTAARGQHIRALHRLRGILMRQAICAGAQLPSFDSPSPLAGEGRGEGALAA